MTLPPEFTCTNPRQVCRLQKSIYGLRQALRQWFAKLSSNCVSMDLFIPMQTILFSPTGKRTFLWLYLCMLTTLCWPAMITIAVLILRAICTRVLV